MVSARILAGTCALAGGIIFGATLPASTTPPTPPPPPPPVNVGPSTGLRAVSVHCTLSDTASVDPIVMPGMLGMSHQHEFFGNTTTNESSTGESLVVGNTTCNDEADNSAYWVPTVTKNGIRVAPTGASIHYYLPAGKTVTAFPQGFKAVAGRSATSAAWGCATAGAPAVFGANLTVPDCAPGAKRVGKISFEQCWDGRLDSSDHTSHLAGEIRTRQGPTCPPGHPIRVPRVVISVMYPNFPASQLRLSSGAATTLHADVFQAWKPNMLAQRISTAPPVKPRP